MPSDFVDSTPRRDQRPHGVHLTPVRVIADRRPSEPIQGSGMHDERRRDDMSMVEGSWARDEGLPLPLGVTWVPEQRAYNFAIYSKHAERVVLQLFCSAMQTSNILVSTISRLDSLGGTNPAACGIVVLSVRRSSAAARYYAYSYRWPKPRRVTIRVACLLIRRRSFSIRMLAPSAGFHRRSTRPRLCRPGIKHGSRAIGRHSAG